MAHSSPIVFAKAGESSPTAAANGTWDPGVLCSEIDAVTSQTCRIQSSLGGDLANGTLCVHTADGSDWSDDDKALIDTKVAAHTGETEANE